MEKENDSTIKSDEEFMSLLLRVQEQNDQQAATMLLDFFEQDMVRLSKFIRMPKEDAIQSMKVELFELFKKK